MKNLTKFIKQKLLDELISVDMPPIHFYCAIGFSIINNYVKDYIMELSKAKEERPKEDPNAAAGLGSLFG